MILDPEAIANIRALGAGDGDDFLKEIVTIFLQDTPVRLNEMAAALTAGDAPVFGRAAHSIKGSSANVGAVALRAAAEKAETEARQDLPAAAAALATLRAEFERTRLALLELVPGVEP